MSNNIHSEKDSLGSRPNKKSGKDEWVEENFDTNPKNTSHRVRKKPTKQMKPKK
jgi:hypothetical protein